MLVIGATVNTRILAGGPGGSGSLNLGPVQGAISDVAAGGWLPLGNELGHVAHVAVEDRGCLLVGEPGRHGVTIPSRVCLKRINTRIAS